MRGAALSDGGQSFIVTHATAVNGTISRIQPTLTPGCHRHHHKNVVDKVVTEYGVAELRGRTIRQRVGGAHRHRRAALPRRAARGREEARLPVTASLQESLDTI